MLLIKVGSKCKGYSESKFYFGTEQWGVGRVFAASHTAVQYVSIQNQDCTVFGSFKIVF